MITDVFSEMGTRPEPWEAYHSDADNLRPRPNRRTFWERIAALTEAQSVFEVGCSVGLNIEQMRGLFPVIDGCDVYQPALVEAERRGARFASLQNVKDLRVPSRLYDLVVSCTVLQHIANNDDLWSAFGNMVRVSRKWVLLMEFNTSQFFTRQPVLWRGNPEGIVKRRWDTFPDAAGLDLASVGTLKKDPDGFDGPLWWGLYRK